MNNNRMRIRQAAYWILGAFSALTLASCASQSAKMGSGAAPQHTSTSDSVPSRPASADASQQTSEPAYEAASAKNLPTVKLWAVVQSVDLDGKKLVVKDKRGRTRSITVGADASLTKGGGNKTVALADIKSGDYLKLMVSGDIARSVHVNVRPSR